MEWSKEVGLFNLLVAGLITRATYDAERKILLDQNLKGTGSGFNFENLDDIIDDPSILQNGSPDEIYSYLKDNGYNPQPLSKGSLGGLSFEGGGGFKVTWGGDRILQYHPTGTHHGGVGYWELSSGPTGTVRYDMFGNIIP